MNGHLYRLVYHVQPYPEGISRERIAKMQMEQDVGACDALLLVSILYPEDGSLSLQMVGCDGRTGKTLDDLELFKVWTMLAKHLSESETLSGVKKEYAGRVFTDISNALQQAVEMQQRNTKD